jgi:hypothetical protein
MQRFRDEGIYVLAGLGGTTEDEVSTKAWTYSHQLRYFAVADSLGKFSNLLGFWLMGNDRYLPVTKAAVRDLKEHFRAAGYRQIPIGSISLTSISLQLSTYMRCDAQDTSVDFLYYYAYTLCPPFPLAYLEESMDALVSFKPEIPTVVSARICKLEAMVDSKILLALNSENYTTTHSGGFLFQYFDDPDPFETSSISASAGYGRYRFHTFESL